LRLLDTGCLHHFSFSSGYGESFLGSVCSTPYCFSSRFIRAMVWFICESLLNF
jgi:hypothetical protein